MGTGGNKSLSQGSVRHKQYANHILNPPVSADKIAAVRQKYFEFASF
jgi:hypothetical protein